MLKENLKMKNYKLIPLLAVTAFLAGCNVNNSSSTKAPNFAKMGKEVTFAEFTEAYTPELLGAWADHEHQHTPSCVVKLDRSQERYAKLDSKKGPGMLMKMVQKENVTVKADLNNLLLSTEGKGTAVTEGTQADSYGRIIKINSTETVNYDTMLQYSTLHNDQTDADEQWLTEVDNTTKMYDKKKNVTTYSDDDKQTLMEDKAFDLAEDNVLPDLLDETLNEYSTLSPVEKENYKFYINNKIFTVIYSSEYTEPDVDGNNEVRVLYNFKIESKIQLDVTNGESFKFKVALKMDMDMKAYKDFADDETTMFAGDTGVGHQYQFASADVKVQDVKLSPVDISNYHLNNTL